MKPTYAPKLMTRMLSVLSKSRTKPYQRFSTEDGQKHAPSSFPFLQLPSEIRNMVYRELLLSTYPLIMHLRNAFWYEPGNRPYPAILQANKQIHDEAAAILYGENIWFSAAGNDFFRWGDDYTQGHREIYDIPPRSCAAYIPWIKHFVLFYDGPPTWIKSRVVAAGDVTSMLARMAIKRECLTELVVATLDSVRCDDIAASNEDWLEVVDDAIMPQRFEWFRDRGSQSAFWLVLKKQ